jgi:hypothetical protein
LTPTNIDAAAGKDWEPDVSVKHSVQKIPCGPLRDPVVVFVFGQSLVSGYLPMNSWSMEFFCCSAVAVGLDAALAIVITPAPLGSASVICSLSLESTTHPAGTGTVNPSFDDVGPVSELGDAIGLGEPAGVGLGTSEVMLPVMLAFPLLRRAIAVPQPAMSTIRAKIAARMSTHGVRWTGAWGNAALGV